MILIMSEYGDNSTVYVSRWLLHKNIPFVRIDYEETYFIEKIKLDDAGYEFIIATDNNKRIKLSEVKAIWYRRGDLKLFFPSLEEIEEKKLKAIMYSQLEMENMTLEYLFYCFMQEIPHIGSFQTRQMNKLHVLREASKLGIKIPDTLVCSSKKVFAESFSHDSVITKGLYEGFRAKLSTGNYTTYTEKISKEEVSDSFFPSLFQKGVEKEADIRSFYLYGEFYTMAIRSQENEQTITDFRKYLKGVGNRSFPFELPNELEYKLHRLMNKLNLETGSIDLIFSKTGEFVFLEINPVGQFGMTSFPCNYYLERRIAEKLIELADYN